MTVAEYMVQILRERGRTHVWYGDLDAIHECAVRSGMYERPGNKHAKAINSRVLSALDSSPYFIKGYIKHLGRPARSFTLKCTD